MKQSINNFESLQPSEVHKQTALHVHIKYEADWSRSLQD